MLTLWPLLLFKFTLATFFLLDREVLHSNYLHDHTITIDGKQDDWPGEAQVLLIKDRPIKQGTIKRVLSDNEVSCRSVWNEDFLYFIIFVKDQNLQAHQKERDHPKLYLDDMVEILLDPALDRSPLWLQDDMVYHINLLEQVKDDRGTAQGEPDSSWNGKATYAVQCMGSLNEDSDVDQGYWVEVAIPMQELGVKPEENTEIGFNLANGDHDGKGRQLFDWRSAWPMRSPHQFGTLKLVK